MIDKVSVDALMQCTDKNVRKMDHFSAFFIKLIDKDYTTNKISECADAYKNAGDHYKHIGQYEDAAKAYEKAGLMYERLPGSDKSKYYDATEQYLNAGNCYIKHDTKKTILFYNIALDCCTNGLNFKKACKIYKDLGKIYEDQKEFKMSIKSYIKALNHNELDFGPANTKKEIMKKLAELGIKNNDFGYSCGIYKKMIEENINDQTLQRYVLKDYILKYILCECTFQFELYDDVLMGKHIEMLLERYVTLLPSFKNTPEYELLCKCVDIFMDEKKKDLGLLRHSFTQLFSDHGINKLFLELVDFYDRIEVTDYEYESIDLS
jgi:tetratricopeptide (TPR) repeat protein